MTSWAFEMNIHLAIRILEVLYRRDQSRNYLSIGFNPLMEEAGFKVEDSVERNRIKETLRSMADCLLVDLSAMNSVCITPAGARIFEEFQKTGKFKL